MSRKKDDPAWREERRKKDSEWRRHRRNNAHWNQRYASLWQYRVDEARRKRHAENRSRQEVQQAATLLIPSFSSVNVPVQCGDALMRLGIRTDVANAAYTAGASKQCTSASGEHWSGVSKQTGLDPALRTCAVCGCPITPRPVPGVGTQTERQLKATQTPAFASSRGTQTCDA